MNFWYRPAAFLLLTLLAFLSVSWLAPPSAAPGWVWRATTDQTLTADEILLSLHKEPDAWKSFDDPPLLGYSTKQLWLAHDSASQSKVSSSPSSHVLEVQPAYLDEVQVLYREQGQWVSKTTGRAFAQSTKALTHLAPAVLVPDPDSTPLLIHIRSTSTLTAIPSLWPSADFSTYQVSYLVKLGCIFGLFLSVLLLTLSHWYTLKESVYAWLAAYVLASAANWLGILGLVSVFVLPETPWLAMRWNGVLLGLSVTSGALFFNHLLDLAKLSKWLSRIYIGTAWVGLVYAVAVALGFANLVGPVAPFTVVLVFMVAFWPITVTLRQPGPKTWIGLTYLLHNLMLFINLTTILGVSTLGWPLHWALQGGFWALVFQIGVLHATMNHFVKRTLQQASEATVRAQHLEQVTQQEREHAEDQERFLAILSHEMRTPVAILAAALKALHSPNVQDSQFRQLRFERMGRALSRIHELIDLGFNHDRLSSGQLTLKREPVDMAQLINSVLHDLPSSAMERLVLLTPSEPVVVEVDWTLWGIVLLNLVDNALKYSPAPNKVQILWGNDGHIFWLCVDDHGPGVALAERELIFEKYHRSHVAQPFPGMGLGLFLARRIVQLHGASLRCETAPGGGCRMRIDMPIHMAFNS